MGSIAMNGAGDIALGYSKSSEAVFPSVLVTGRLYDDPLLNVMTQGESVIVTGSNSQAHGSGRWGDYSHMSVDPVDDCTFWYTQVYYDVDNFPGLAWWHTRIGSVKLQDCVQAAVTDIAITNVSALSPVVQGDPDGVFVSVTVDNVGNQDVTDTFSVSLDELPDTHVGDQNVNGLPAGDSITLQFNWAASTLGDRTLTASTAFVDAESGNNSSSTVVTVEAAVTDIAITGVSAPSPVVQGDDVPVMVTVQNVGNQNVTADTFTVSLDELPDTHVGDQNVDVLLEAGASTILLFNWAASTLGDRTLTASTAFVDAESGNNSGSTVVTVNEPSVGVTVTFIDPPFESPGITRDFVITGSGFSTAPNVVVEVAFENGTGGPTPRVNSVAVDSSMRITANVEIRTGGPPRERTWDVRVTNPDGSTGVGVGLLRIIP